MRRTMRGGAAAAWVACATLLAGCQAGTATPEPAPSRATAASSPTTSADPACDWAARQADLEPVEDRDPDLEPALTMADWVWDCVNADWDVTVSRVLGGEDLDRIDEQDLDLVAPDGTRVLLYPLRGDVAVDVVSADPASRLAWTARMGGGDTYQVVQVDLETGEATEDWGEGAVPSTAVRDGAVYSVGPYLQLRDGTTLWASFHYLGDVSGLFVYEGDGAFTPIPGAERVEAMLAEGSVNRWGDPGVSVWVAPNEQWAAILGQRQVGSDPFASSELGRWLAVDLQSGETRTSTSPLPAGLCRPVDGGTLAGTFAEPGGIPAECWDGEGGDQGYTLSLTEAPVEG